MGQLELLEGNVVEAIAKLKEDDGPELQVLGSAELLQTLLANNLVDEFRLWIWQAAFGEGGRPAGLELTNSARSTRREALAD